MNSGKIKYDRVCNDAYQSKYKKYLHKYHYRLYQYNKHNVFVRLRGPWGHIVSSAPGQLFGYFITSTLDTDFDLEYFSSPLHSTFKYGCISCDFLFMYFSFSNYIRISNSVWFSDYWASPSTTATNIEYTSLEFSLTFEYIFQYEINCISWRYMFIGHGIFSRKIRVLELSYNLTISSVSIQNRNK